MNLLIPVCLRCPRVQPPPYTGQCSCTVSGRDILEHAETGECPKGYFSPVAIARQQLASRESAARVERERLEMFRAAWRELHTLALTDSLTDARLRAIFKFLPLGCGCNNDATAYLNANPLPRTEQFAWSVTFHNHVSDRIGKPEMAVDAALAFWMA